MVSWANSVSETGTLEGLTMSTGAKERWSRSRYRPRTLATEHAALMIPAIASSSTVVIPPAGARCPRPKASVLHRGAWVSTESCYLHGSGSGRSTLHRQCTATSVTVLLTKAPDGWKSAGLDGGVLLWDTVTGDTWRMSGMIDRGLVYRGLPERIDGCMIGLRGCSP